jgi:hypothetical protein
MHSLPAFVCRRFNNSLSLFVSESVAGQCPATDSLPAITVCRAGTVCYWLQLLKIICPFSVFYKKRFIFVICNSMYNRHIKTIYLLYNLISIHYVVI